MRTALRPPARAASRAQYLAMADASTGAAAIAKNGTWRAERSARNPQTTTSTASNRSACGARATVASSSSANTIILSERMSGD